MESITKEKIGAEILQWVDEEKEQYSQELIELASEADGCCDSFSKAKIISKPIDLVSILNIIKNEKPVWHITPLFDSQISYRYSFLQFDRKGNRDTWSGRIYLEGRREPIITDLAQLKKVEHSGSGISITPNAPPIIPSKIKEYGKKLEEDYKLTPYILYKPDSWTLIEHNDPALVANISGEWRVFAIWGSVVEEAEILTFCKIKKD